MFVDHATIHCEAGSGGKGCNSYERGRHLKHPRPHGGDGGRGGSVILMASEHVHTLLDLKMRQAFRAASGKHGGANAMTGKSGQDTRVTVPVGTEVHDEEGGFFLKDLCHHADELLVCEGGAGGKGNHRHQEATQGRPGEKKRLRLELKLIADVGLVGCPNAGKSTLISHLSNAKSRIAAFPFTTKEPVLGVVKSLEGDAMVLADIPGLVEGAHQGRGMGIQFLRHIERTRILVLVLDMAGTEGRDPAADYAVVKRELVRYSDAFRSKRIVIAANKMDIPQASEYLIKFEGQAEEPVFPVSAATGRGLKELVGFLIDQLKVDAAKE